MNKLFKNPKKFLSVSLIITAFVLAVGVALVAFLGFNRSYHYGGYYEINIDYIDEANKQDYVNGVGEILEKYGYSSAYDNLNGEKSYTPSICIRYESNSEEDAALIKKEIIQKFSIDEKNNLLTVDKVSTSYHSLKTINFLIPVSIVLVLLFIYGMVRKNILFGVAEVISYVFTLLLGLSLYAITRATISTLSLTMLFLSALIASVLFTYCANLAYSKQASVHAQNKGLGEHYGEAVSSLKLTLGIPTALLFFAFLGLLFTSNYALMNVGIAGMACVATIAWVSLFLTGAYFASVENSKERKTKKIMSRNNTENKKEEI